MVEIDFDLRHLAMVHLGMMMANTSIVDYNIGPVRSLIGLDVLVERATNSLNTAAAAAGDAAADAGRAIELAELVVC